MRNMGGYCLMHGHHPVSINHISTKCTQKRDNHNGSTTATHCMGGCMFWLGITRVRPSQQDHQSYKGKSAPKWQGHGLDKLDITNNIRKAAFYKIKPALLSNYYSILSNITPPPCQVEEQGISKQPESIHNINEMKAFEQLIKKEVLNGSIPSIIADSAATSHVGTKHDPFIPMGRTSKKIFQLPNRTRTAASTISELTHNVRQPAKDVHIVPTIKTNSLLSTANLPQLDTSPFLMTKRWTFMTRKTQRERCQEQQY
jgi:hypothetical protein